MKHLTSRILHLASLLLIAAGCSPTESSTPDTLPQTPDDIHGHMLVLNEGLWGANNASLSRIDLDSSTVEANWFATVNHRGLGDVAQDLIVYGSKAYISVWGSNSLEVVDTATGIGTHVDLGNRGPRYIAAAGGKLYVSCYKPHSVVRIDTATLQVEATCPLGDFNPEGIAIAGSRLFVASSNVSDEQGAYTYDSIVYAIDLPTFTNPHAVVVVGSNPQQILPLGDGRVLVGYIGDYAANPAGSAVIEANTLSVQQTGQPISNMAIADGTVYGYSLTYDDNWNSVANFFTMDIATLTPRPLQLAGLGECPYSIAVHPVSGHIFVGTDGGYVANGRLMCFSPDGASRHWSREVGMLPSRIVYF